MQLSRLKENGEWLPTTGYNTDSYVDITKHEIDVDGTDEPGKGAALISLHPITTEDRLAALGRSSCHDEVVGSTAIGSSHVGVPADQPGDSTCPASPTTPVSTLVKVGISGLPTGSSQPSNSSAAVGSPPLEFPADPFPPLQRGAAFPALRPDANFLERLSPMGRISSAGAAPDFGVPPADATRASPSSTSGVKPAEAVCEIAAEAGSTNISSISIPGAAPSSPPFVDVKVAYDWRPMHPLKKCSVNQKSSRKDLAARCGAIPVNRPVGTLDERGCLSSKDTLDADNSQLLKAENSGLYLETFAVNPEPIEAPSVEACISSGVGMNLAVAEGSVLDVFDLVNSFAILQNPEDFDVQELQCGPPVELTCNAPISIPSTASDNKPLEQKATIPKAKMLVDLEPGDDVHVVPPADDASENWVTDSDSDDDTSLFAKEWNAEEMVAVGILLHCTLSFCLQCCIAWCIVQRMEASCFAVDYFG
ncbi:hypothetical protein Nepgr_016407 [Nepenthes gracilis]|uniref:Uncharacterized protein n=1 Tax=Nepenthes gracilis TaxID=150966 RepID=A0AAD3XS97_NEPGR|nr:hypothetical protein Nepgr_016407 [Nepenthes gracilis]